MAILHITEKQALERYNTKIKLYSNGEIKIKKYSTSLERLKEGYELEKRTFKISKNNSRRRESGKMLIRNLARTRNTLMDYAIENKNIFHSFITLTLSDDKNRAKSTEIDINDIKEANKLFNIFITQLRRKYPNLAYMGVPEFQKRGAVHYHLLTNLRCGIEIPAREPKRTYNKAKNKWYEFIYYDIPYWNYGYSTAMDLDDTDENFNVALYIAKYLYKDIDNRLFDRKKILKSNNLNKPKEVLCNSPTFLQAFSYLIKKGYEIEEYKFRPTLQFQIPYNAYSTKISQYDYNILCNDITRATK